MKPTPPLCRVASAIAGLALLGGLASTNAFATSPLTDEARAQLADRVFFDVGAPGEAFDSFIVYYRDDAAPNDEKSDKAIRTRQKLDNDLERVAKSLGHKSSHQRRLATGGHLIQLQGKKTLADSDAALFMAELAANKDVLFVEPNARAYPALVPTDPLYSNQWGLNNTIGGVNAPSAWDISTGAGVTIAIVDTGSTAHPDLDNQTVAGYDFITQPDRARDGNGRDANPNDDGDWRAQDECPFNPRQSDSSWHGTHVAGIAAAQANNGIGVVGLAYGAKIQHVRVLGRCGGTTADIADGIIWASGGSVTGVPNNATPSRVINLSLGGMGGCGPTYQNAINQARARGAVVIAAAGNDNSPATQFTPANCSGAISVAASTRQGTRAPYSNYGEGIDIAAPGGDLSVSGASGIASTLNEGKTTATTPSYVYYQGTSMAAPFVAGAAALMIAREPSLTPTKIEEVLLNSARPFPAASICTKGCGVGILDANAAARAVGTNPTALTQYPLSVSLDGNAPGVVSSTPSGISCGRNCSSRFTIGSAITLRANPSSGNEFAGWTGACSGTDPVCTVTLDRAKLAIANFRVPQIALRNNRAVSGISLAEGQMAMYTLEVPAGSTLLNIRLREGSGNADMFVSRDIEPTDEKFECGPKRPTNAETCSFQAPMAGTYYILLKATQAFEGVKLQASFNGYPLGGLALINTVTRKDITAQEDGARYYRVNVPQGAKNLRITTEANNGDLDMYVRHNDVPSLDVFDQISGNIDSNESVYIKNPAAGTHYVMLHAYEAYNRINITANFANLTINKSGQGTGSVQIRRVSNGSSGPSCHALPCEVSLYDASVDLIAVPSASSQFAGWNASECDRITAEGHCRVRPNPPRSVTARFTGTADRALTIKKSAAGDAVITIKDASNNRSLSTCTIFPCTVNAPNALLDLEVQTIGNTRFLNWSNNCQTPSASTCRIRTDASKEVTVTLN